IGFDRLLAGRDPARLLVFCDEDAPLTDPVAALAAARHEAGACAPALAVLVGPEGGFSDAERTALARLPNVARLALGPRILPADTGGGGAPALGQRQAG